MSNVAAPSGAGQCNALAEAAAFAFRLHADQRRKGTAIPYLSHLMAASAWVLVHGGDEERAVDDMERLAG